jgi:hypothetical protein
LNAGVAMLRDAGVVLSAAEFRDAAAALRPCSTRGGDVTLTRHEDD